MLSATNVLFMDTTYDLQDKTLVSNICVTVIVPKVRFSPICVCVCVCVCVCCATRVHSQYKIRFQVHVVQNTFIELAIMQWYKASIWPLIQISKRNRLLTELSQPGADNSRRVALPTAAVITQFGIPPVSLHQN